MQLNQVRYFIEASRLLNFTKAAEICHVTQPALTKGIKALEDELGGPLFHRSPKLCLTDLGRRVLPFVEQTYEAANAVRQQARCLHSGEVVPIGIGLDATISTSLIRPILAELCRSFPGLSVRLLTAPVDAMLRALLDGEIDLIARANNGDADRHLLHRLPLVTESFDLVFASTHRFADTEDIDLNHLLTASDRISFCRTADRLLAELGTLEPARHVVSTPSQLDNLIQLDAGWALLPKDHKEGGAGIRRTLPEPGVNRLIELVYPAGRLHGPAVSAFIRLARMGARPTYARAS
jgi:DNA-binding transcriptional LysR family regulator